MAIRMAMVLSLLLAGASCASSGVDTIYGDSTDFTQYRTWKWLPTEAGSSAGVGPDMDRRIRSAIKNAMKERGLEPTGEAPDFLVSYSMGASAVGSPRAGGYHSGAWGARRTVQTGGAVSDTTLSLVFTGADTGQLVWKGSASGVIADPGSEDTNVTKTIHRILAEYPPAGQ